MPVDRFDTVVRHSQLGSEVAALAARVEVHLAKMGTSWK